MSDEKSGTIILDATCAPQNIAFPQDINLLNESRVNLEEIIDTVCYEYNEAKPCTYRDNARKDYLALAKRRKSTGKAIHKAIKKQLQYVKRDLRYVDDFLAEGKELSAKQAARLEVIRKVYDQQKYMYDNNTHKVPDRIVSISQPYIRPIVRGKAKTPTEFGTKLDMSIDEKGMAMIEKQSFDPYDESDVLRTAVERGFSLAKRNYGLGLIRTRLDTTTRCSICLSIIAMNIRKLYAASLCDFLESIFQGTNWVFQMISGSPRYVN